MKRLLITGAAGFIGSAAIPHFSRLGYQVTGTDMTGPRRPLPDGVDYHTVDLRDRPAVISLFAKVRPELLLHLGARTDTFERRSLDGYAANIDGMRHLLEAANRIDELRRMIITSSRLVCRIGYTPSSDTDYRPPNLYGQSKVETEKVVRSNNIRAEWILTRPTAIWGPGFQVPSYRDFFEQVRKGRYFHIGNTAPMKTFGYIDNFLFQMEKLLTAPREAVHERVFYIGDYESIRLPDWANLIAEAFGRPHPAKVPLWILSGVARVGNVLKAVGWDNVPLTTHRLHNMLIDSVHDCSPLEAITGPLPVGLREATLRTVEWMKAENS